MKWRGGRRSRNIEDRRGRRGGRRGSLMGGGIGGIILVVIALLLGADMNTVMQLLGGVQQASAPNTSGTALPADDEQAQFVAVVLADTEDVWSKLYAQSGERYRPPKLVLFEGSVRSACGFNTTATGPFYCPGDQKVYLDLSFFRQLEQLGAPGDFARAYVIGHEVGHHIQRLTGTEPQVRQMQRNARSQAEANRLSVAMELQADCYAGVWGHHAEADRDLLETGDVAEGLRAAAAIGDDRLQGRSGGAVQPETWTHGSSAQRREWLLRGLQTGDPNQCNTFAHL